MIDNKDDVAILVCQIKVWQPGDRKWFEIPSIHNCTFLHECEQIEITQTYMDSIGKCVLHIPRGTIIENTDTLGTVRVGNKTNQKSETDLDIATGFGDVVVPDSASYVNGKNVVSIQPYRDDIGLINEFRGSDAHIASADDFAVGNRIQIRCGYVYSENVNRIDEIYSEDMPPELKVVFTGFITGCSLDSPLEVECEDMGSLLKKTNCPKFTPGKDYYLSDFFGDKVDVLNETGLDLTNSSREGATKINVGRVDLSVCTTVNDLLDKFRKDNGIVSYVEVNPVTGKAALRIGEAYYKGTDGLDNTEPQYINYRDNLNATVVIRSDWDVASDNLEISRIDKRFLAIECHGELKEGKKFGFTLRKRVGGNDKEDEFDIVNRREPRLKKKGKRKKAQPGHVVESAKDKVDMKDYVKVKYVSSKKYTTEEELLSEAKVFWRKYSPNGVSGNITVFGDVYVSPGDIVGIINKRQPEKNGYYIVESVSTKFGVSGYRRELKLPYRLAPLHVEEIK